MILASWTHWYFFNNFFVNWGRHLDFDNFGFHNSGSGSFVSRPPFAGLSINETGDGSSERVDTSSGNYFGNKFFDFNGDFFDNVFVLHGLVNKAMAIERISAISQVMVRQW